MNSFRNMLGLPEARWQDKEEGQGQPEQSVHDLKQSTLSGFLS